MDNRQNILHHALTLFAARGYEGVGVQEVCVSAGITKPTLYHYFGSKRGLLQALVEERCAPFLNELGEAADYRGDLPLTLGLVVRTYFYFAKTEPVLCRLLLVSWFSAPESEACKVTAPVYERQLQMAEELFLRAGEDHSTMRGKHTTYAAALLGMIHTHAALALNGKEELNERTARDAVHQFSHGIYS